MRDCNANKSRLSASIGKYTYKDKGKIKPNKHKRMRNIAHEGKG